MLAQDVSADYLRRIDFKLQRSPTIDGVVLRELKTHLDGRGDVIELWSEPWPDVIKPSHIYQSATDAGVIKAWHLHQVHTDQFTCTRGKLQVVVADVRDGSASFGHVNSFVLGVQRPLMIRIPPGTIHGWKALSPPEAIVVNFQSHVYDPSDEFKLPWDCVLSDVWEPRNG